MFVAGKLSADFFSDVSANSSKYGPQLEPVSAGLAALDEQFAATVEENSMYLAKSGSRYSYEGEKPDKSGKYKHDYYIGNESTYSSTMLLDKLSDLRRFTADPGNMHVWAFRDGLSAVEADFLKLSAAVDSLKERLYIKKIAFNDVGSAYLDEEVECIADAVAEAKSGRTSQLESLVQTTKSIADDEYSQAVQQLKQAQAEYVELGKQYS